MPYLIVKGTLDRCKAGCIDAVRNDGGINAVLFLHDSLPELADAKASTGCKNRSILATPEVMVGKIIQVMDGAQVPRENSTFDHRRQCVGADSVLSMVDVVTLVRAL